MPPPPKTTSLPRNPAFYRDVLQSLHDAILITDFEDRILFANRGFETLTGWSLAEVEGRIAYEILLDESGWEAMRRRGRERRARKSEAYKIEMRTRSGERRWVQVRGTPWISREGETLGTIGCMLDIQDQEILRLHFEYMREKFLEYTGQTQLIGESPALRHVQEQIELVAPTDANVLLLGESGTGKELVATEIHRRSQRNASPLIRVNCAAVPKDLFESEFFGHVRGAFTGAIRTRPGRFELADQGSLFLDEIGEIPLDLQGKLLRVIQEGELERVGDDHTRSVNVRIIAATNRDLETEVAAGRFREDLYYRLNVFPVHLPPLRERGRDVVLLAKYFIGLASARMGLPQAPVSDQELDRLQRYDWPGNVRELENIVERAVILARGGPLQFPIRHKPDARSSQPGPPPPQHASPDLLNWTLHDCKMLERDLIAAQLEAAGGSIYGPKGAAARLGIKPTTLASRIKKLGL